MGGSTHLPSGHIGGVERVVELRVQVRHLALHGALVRVLRRQLHRQGNDLLLALPRLPGLYTV